MDYSSLYWVLALAFAVLYGYTGSFIMYLACLELKYFVVISGQALYIIIESA